MVLAARLELFVAGAIFPSIQNTNRQTVNEIWAKKSVGEDIKYLYIYFILQFIDAFWVVQTWGTFNDEWKMTDRFGRC